MQPTNFPFISNNIPIGTYIGIERSPNAFRAKIVCRAKHIEGSRNFLALKDVPNKQVTN